MQAIATCINGLEFIAQQEIKNIIKVKSEVIHPSRVLFNPKTEKDIAKFIYYARSIIKSYLLIAHLEFTSKDEIISKIKELNFPYLKYTFVVRCERTGNHNFNSQDIEKEAGEIIFEKSKIKVDLENATTTIIVDIIDNKCFIGTDFTGIKLSKRDYRIKLTNNTLNSCLAYCLVRISDYKLTDSLLDPFAKCGEIAIEAAQYASQIPNCLRLNDKLLFNKLFKVKFKDSTKEKKLNIYAVDSLQNNLSCAEINAKIGSVRKYIKFSKLDIEWLDTKFKKNSIDKVVTFPIYPTNTLPQKSVEKLYKELFYQLEFILKKNGIIAILTPVPELIEKYAQEYKFKIENTIEIEYNGQKFYILNLRR